MAVALALAWHSGAAEWLAAPKALAQRLVDMGPAGYAIFVLCNALLQPFGVPGTVFVVAAPLIWPWPVAFALSMLGTMLASVIGFSFARYLARDWVRARIPARLQRFDAALQTHAFLTVFALRLLLWMPQALHFFLGVSPVPFWTHVWGSLLGYVPPLLTVSYLGDQLFSADGQLQTDAWPAMIALVVGSVLLIAVVRHLLAKSTHKTQAQAFAPRISDGQ